MTIFTNLGDDTYGMKNIKVDSDIRCGVPCVPGTRFTVAQLVSELSGGRSLGEIAEDFDLEFDMLERCLEDLARELDKKSNIIIW